MNNLSELAASNLVSVMSQLGGCLNNFNVTGDRRYIDNLLPLAQAFNEMSAAIAHLTAAGLVEPESLAIWVKRVGLMAAQENTENE